MRNSFHSLYQTGSIIRLDAPADPPAPPPNFELTHVTRTQTVQIAPPAAQWPRTPGQVWLWAYAMKPTSQAAFYPNEPWRKLDWNVITTGHAYKNPWRPTYPFNITNAKKLWVEIIAQPIAAGVSNRAQRTCLTST
jgi:hypothetical protein